MYVDMLLNTIEWISVSIYIYSTINQCNWLQDVLILLRTCSSRSISQLSHCCNEPLQYHSTLSPIGIRRSLICLNLKGLSSHKWHPYPCHLEPFTGGRDWLPHMHSFSSPLHETAGWMWTVEVYHTNTPFMEARYVLWIDTAAGQLNLN